MIKNCLKNFFKSIWLYFIPLGVIALFVAIGLSVFIPNCVNLVSGTFKQISEKLQQTSFDWNAVQQLIIGKFFEYSGDPGKLSELVSSPEALTALLKEVVNEAFGVSTLSDDIINLVRDCANQIILQVVGLVIIFVVSVIVGFLFLKIALRKYLTDRNSFKVILVSILDGIVFGAMVYLFIYLMNHVSEGAAWAVGISVGLVLLFIIPLIEAYLFYGIRKVKFTQVLNFKTFFGLIVGDIIILALGGGLCFLLYLIPNRVLAIIVIVPLAELLVCVLGLNCETYVIKVAEDNKIDKRIEKEKAAAVEQYKAN